jgi:glycosyltransferase involved in cell wall biosynthesis
MQKRTLLIVINDLQKGGAEILLVDILPELNERYNVVLVTLKSDCDFAPEEIICSQYYNLAVNSKFSVVKGVRQLKRIIRKHDPFLVHAHLTYSSIIARLACPPSIPVAFTLHEVLSSGSYKNNRLLALLEKKSIRKNHSIIAVSNEALIDYERIIKKMTSRFVLSNYIRDVFFKQKIASKDYNHSAKLRLVAVGNIRTEKNYIYLVKALKHLKDLPITLDIYGKTNTDILKSLQKEISLHQLPIVFKGSVDNIHQIMQHYDLYVLSSEYEGFGIAVAEAMALGLPLLLSDLPTLRTVTFNNAVFFDIGDKMSFVNRIKEMLEEKYDLNTMSAKGIILAKENYTKTAYLEKLFDIYKKIAE